jgi:hypothetical protein
MSKAPAPKWQNRITKHGTMPAGEFLANPLNWRLHPEFQQDALAGALSEVGWIDEVTVNARTGRVVDGHLRVTLALRSSEHEPVPYREVDLSEEEEALVLATKDPIAALAATDPAQLSATLEMVSTGDEALQQLLSEMSFDAEMRALLAGDDTPENRNLGKAPNLVRVVLRVDDLALVEETLATTGEADRGKSLAAICRAYLDAKG